MNKVLPRVHARIARVFGAPLRGRLPDFFIIGAARSGTTSLWQYLRQHPQLFLPGQFVDKEPSYFCDIYGVPSRSRYLSLFAGARPDQLIGDASTPYLTCQKSAEWIHEEVPNAKIIVLLRNPANRAFSLYKWMREHGFEHCETFADALWAEEHTRAGNDNFKYRNPQYYFNYLYFRSGEYAEQLNRYFNAFGRERIRVLIFEEFVKDPTSAVQDLYNFLEVKTDFTPDIAIHNPTFEQVEIDEHLRQELLARYAPAIERLEKLLGRDLKSLWS